jgi:hypothetical protein
MNNSTQELKFCFVLSPIGDPFTATRKRADGVLKEIIRPVMKERGYRAERADHDLTPGIITEAIIRKALDADFVIADLTSQNPNVMYELALRHMVGKPFVQMIEEGETIPFDIGGVNTVKFVNELNGAEAAREALGRAVDAAPEHSGDSNPVRRTIQLDQLRGQVGEEDSAILQLIQDLHIQLTDMRQEVFLLRRRDKEAWSREVRTMELEELVARWHEAKERRDHLRMVVTHAEAHRKEAVDSEEVARADELLRAVRQDVVAAEAFFESLSHR